MIIEDDNGGTINTHNPDRDQLVSEVEFRNVTISILATSPREAYVKLTELLQVGIDNKLGLEYSTDTFVTNAEPGLTRSTAELWELE